MLNKKQLYKVRHLFAAGDIVATGEDTYRIVNKAIIKLVDEIERLKEFGIIMDRLEKEFENDKVEFSEEAIILWGEAFRKQKANRAETLVKLANGVLADKMLEANTRLIVGDSTGEDEQLLRDNKKFLREYITALQNMLDDIQ